jgi:Na+/proline symporter
MSFLLTVVNLVFLSLGALLYMYAEAHPEMKVASGDLLFSTIAMSAEAGTLIGILFLLGLIAAAYSSADSALTALTTSFSVDFLGVKNKKKDELIDHLAKSKENEEKTRKLVHIGMSGITVLTVIALKYGTNESAIDLVMKLAGFTYGPLIGMFFFGILSNRFIKDKIVPFVCFGSILLTILVWYFSSGAPGNLNGDYGLLGGYKFGFEIIILNAFITFIGISLFSKPQEQTTRNENSTSR